jgi:hypothetical protein
MMASAIQKHLMNNQLKPLSVVGGTAWVAFDEPVMDYKFTEDRLCPACAGETYSCWLCEGKTLPRYELDVAWPKLKLAVEINGGIWSRGSHGRGKGIQRDYHKQQLAALMGWQVIPFSPEDVKQGRAFRTIVHLLKGADHGTS